MIVDILQSKRKPKEKVDLLVKNIIKKKIFSGN